MYVYVEVVYFKGHGESNRSPRNMNGRPLEGPELKLPWKPLLLFP